MPRGGYGSGGSGWASRARVQAEMHAARFWLTREEVSEARWKEREAELYRAIMKAEKARILAEYIQSDEHQELVRHKAELKELEKAATMATKQAKGEGIYVVCPKCLKLFEVSGMQKHIRSTAHKKAAKRIERLQREKANAEEKARKAAEKIAHIKAAEQILQERAIVAEAVAERELEEKAAAEAESAAKALISPVPCEHCGALVHPSEKRAHEEVCPVLVAEKRTANRVFSIYHTDIESADIRELRNLLESLINLRLEVQKHRKPKKLLKDLDAIERRLKRGIERKEKKVEMSRVLDDIAAFKKSVVLETVADLEREDMSDDDYYAQELALARTMGSLQTRPPKAVRKTEKRVKKALKTRKKQAERLTKAQLQKAQTEFRIDTSSMEKERLKLAKKIASLDLTIQKEQEKLAEIDRKLESLERELAALIARHTGEEE